MRFIGLFAKVNGVGPWCLLTTYDPNPGIAEARARAMKSMNTWQHVDPRTTYRVEELEGSSGRLWKTDADGKTSPAVVGWPAD